ncbi:MAG TPA: protein-methionine-sulfoxide reductase heme-binding subunit MsrQ [Candidatus Dormibacteraeota bacterium]|nr:protein-methionine-sulfoxide reductase heme-binding subunit MsrQ [Candidatus Dormibacteraeota bacterium]
MKKSLVALALLPAAWLAVGAWRDALGANPIEAITHATGLWGLRFLLASLAITPLRRLSGWNWLISYRRTLGLLAFTYAMLHVATFVVLDHYFDWTAIVADVRKRPYVTAGALAFTCLVPLALTSTRGWIRRLGKRWTTLHRLAYVAAIAVVIHYWWLVKADVRAPLWYGAALALLLLARTAPVARRRPATA